MTKDETKDLINMLVKQIMQINKPERFRVAVTGKEFAALRQYFLKETGRFHARIANIPLLIVDNIDHPLMTEYSRGLDRK